MITLFAKLLRNYVITQGTNSSVAAANAIAARQYHRFAYVVKVLEAPQSTRVSVRSFAEASNSSGQKQFAALLAFFETLSAEKKTDFIITFKAASSLHVGATPSIAIQTAWQQGHIPPVYEP